MSKRVLCAMSGGVDSSVVAALLVEQGYDVIGVTMKLWKGEDDPFAAHRFNGCCGIGGVEDARSVANKIGIPYYVMNLQQEFKEAVVDDFVSEYAKGRTPNPCARCNQFIKFDTFLERADELNCEYIATGHYAQVEQAAGESTFVLRRGLDQRKDQSYMLGMLTQKELARVILPVGGIEKSQTRSLAEGFGFCVARKPDSQEICFVEDGDYAKFVEDRVPELAVAGPIYDKEGHLLGEHKGLAHYTVGQRKGLGISAATPLFVTKIDAENGALIVGGREDLLCHGFQVTGAKWTHEELSDSAEILAQTRSHGRATPARIANVDGDTYAVHFVTPQFGIAPGQLSVIYQEDMVRGAGTIDKTF